MNSKHSTNIRFQDVLIACVILMMVFFVEACHIKEDAHGDTSGDTGQSEDSDGSSETDSEDLRPPGYDVSQDTVTAVDEYASTARSGF